MLIINLFLIYFFFILKKRGGGAENVPGTVTYENKEPLCMMWKEWWELKLEKWCGSNCEGSWIP